MDLKDLFKWTKKPMQRDQSTNKRRPKGRIQGFQRNKESKETYRTNLKGPQNQCKGLKKLSVDPKNWSIRIQIINPKWPKEELIKLVPKSQLKDTQRDNREKTIQKDLNTQLRGPKGPMLGGPKNKYKRLKRPKYFKGNNKNSKGTQRTKPREQTKNKQTNKES